ncbi:MAG: SGNH/GDSL hydrolase family protein [Alphaproteobacteria bacterium]
MEHRTEGIIAQGALLEAKDPVDSDGIAKFHASEFDDPIETKSMPDQNKQLSPTKTSTAIRLVGTIAIFATILVGYVTMEIAYRWYIQGKLESDLVDHLLKSLPPTSGAGATYVFDSEIGYRYVPNSRIHYPPPFDTDVRINKWGHVGKEDYPKIKPESEFRVAFIGDSYTALVSANTTWVELVEPLLNSSSAWKRYTGEKNTRTLNFGFDGIGAVQFAAIARHEVPEFQPDLVIVNFISNDLYRKFRMAGLPNWTDGHTRTGFIREHVRKHYIAAVDWYAVYPELVARLIDTVYPITSRIPRTLSDLEFLAPGKSFQSRDEAVAASVTAFESIRQQYPETVFLHNPRYDELAGAPPESIAGIMENFTSHLPTAIRPVRMEKYLEQYIQDQNLEAMYHLPFDQHPNDLGAYYYALAVATYLTGPFIGNDAPDFDIDSIGPVPVYSPPPNAPKGPPINLPLATLPENPEASASIGYRLVPYGRGGNNLHQGTIISFANLLPVTLRDRIKRASVGFLAQLTDNSINEAQTPEQALSKISKVIPALELILDEPGQRHFVVLDEMTAVHDLWTTLERCRISIVDKDGTVLEQTMAARELPELTGRKLLQLVSSLKTSESKSLQPSQYLLLPPCAEIDPRKINPPVTAVRIFSRPLFDEILVYQR